MLTSEIKLIADLVFNLSDNITLFHYTSPEGLLGIIDKRALWISNMQYLNDATELSYAAGFLRNKLERKLDEEPGQLINYYLGILDGLEEVSDAELYVGSFSEQGDLLSQWRAYTPTGIGFSIGFQCRYLISLAVAQRCELGKCLYQESEHDKVIEALLEHYSRWTDDAHCDSAVSGFFLGFYTVAPFLKRSSFSEEREWRVVKLAPIGIPENFAPRHRPGRSMLVPYTNFELAKEDGRISFSKVFVGPTPHMELSISSLRNLLLASGVNGCKVAASTIPYRSW